MEHQRCLIRAHRLVSSPAFLGFTFRANNSVTQNMTINVPFRLLNLNLTEPLAHVDTPYFPCSLPSLNTYRLGRSFLQAAFMSVNWMTNYDGYWFLAQAPGPNIAPVPKVVTIGVNDSTLLPSANTWIDSWLGYWLPIAEDGTKSAPNSTTNAMLTSSSGSKDNNTTSMSTAFEVGIGMAAAAVALAMTAGVVLFVRKEKRRSRTGKSTQPGLESHKDMVPHPIHNQDRKSTAVPCPSELSGSQLSELHGISHIAEAPASQTYMFFGALAELDGSPSTDASTPITQHR